MLQRRLCEAHRPRKGRLLHLPRHCRVAPHTGAQQLHQRRIRHRECVLAPVGLIDCHVQVAAVPRGVQVVDLERPGRHGGFQNDVAILGDNDARIRTCDSVHHRCVLELRIRQHLIVAGQGNPSEAETVEHGAIREAVSHCQITADRRDIVSEIGGDVLVAGRLVRGDFERGSLAQVPAA